MSPARNLPASSGSISLPSAARQLVRDLEHRGAAAAADVDRAAVGAVALERQAAGAGDVGDVHEVAPLAAVLVDQRRPAVQQPRGEDREHAGVRVRERLPRPVDVEEAQRHRRHAVGRPVEQAHPLLVVLGQRVDRGERRLLRLRRRHGRSASPPGPRGSHSPRSSCVARALDSRGGRAASVERPRRRCSCSRRRRASAPGRSSSASSSTAVPSEFTEAYSRELVHALADSDRGRRDGRRRRSRRARRATTSALRTSPAISSTSAFR